MQWELITNIILISALVVLALFILLGLYQWITRKSLRKVDRELLMMPIPLALAAITYFVFEKLIIINTRPNGSGEPSFPSTHTMIVATIFFLTIIALPKYIKSKSLRLILDLFMGAFVILIGVGRVLANMHWATDVAAALGFALAFAIIYYILINKGVSHAQHLY